MAERYSSGRSLLSLMPRFILMYCSFVILFFTFANKKHIGQRLHMQLLWFMLPSYLRLFLKTAYLRTVKVCCQHNDWVGKDVCRVSAGKEGLSGKSQRNADSVLTSNLNVREACKTKFSGVTWLTRKLTPDCIQDILLQISPWGGRFSVPLRGAGSPLRTFAVQTQSLCPESPFDPRRRTSPLYWNGHYLQGTLPLGSKTVKYSNNMVKKTFSVCTL